MYQAPRGTEDILPEEQPYWRYIELKIADICHRYGYQRIDTPVFEETSLFTRGVGAGTDIVEKEMYTFEDKGGSSLTLRPEGTAPVCRAYLEHGMQSLPKPVKLYYFSSVFRYERPQAGRYRQHHQFGYEAIGEANPTIDAEVIEMAWQVFLSLKLERLKLKLNSIGCKECRPGYLEILKGYYEKHAANLCPDCTVRIKKNPLRVLDCKNPGCQRIADAAPRSVDYLCPACEAHFSSVKKYLGLYLIPFDIDHRLVRGLDYYTRTVFEIQPEEEGGQSTIGGGGRYDGLIEELGGPSTPALGFATGIERIILNLKRQGVTVPSLPEPQVFIASLGEPARDVAVRLGAVLRKMGLRTIISVGEKSLKAQMKHADSLGARKTFILGEEELKSMAVTVRDMTTSEQKTVPLSQLAGVLEELQEPSRLPLPLDRLQELLETVKNL